MAKLTIEEAKVKLLPIENAINALKSMNMEVPASIVSDFEKLTKIISGSSNVNVSNTFNEKLAPQINGHAEFRELLAKQIGTRVKLSVVVTTNEDGTHSIKFEAGSASGGGQKSGTSVGSGTKAATPFNNYHIKVIGDMPEYEVKETTVNTAAGAVQFILNGGKNPFNLGAEFGKGNSMKRVLLGDNNDEVGKGGLTKHEAFAPNFALICSYVEPVKKEEAPAEATPAAE